MNGPKNRQSEERNSQIASVVFVGPVVVGGCAAGPCGPGGAGGDGGEAGGVCSMVALSGGPRPVRARGAVRSPRRRPPKRGPAHRWGGAGTRNTFWGTPRRTRGSGGGAPPPA